MSERMFKCLIHTILGSQVFWWLPFPNPLTDSFMVKSVQRYFLTGLEQTEEQPL